MLGLGKTKVDGKIIAWILIQGFGFDDSDLSIGKIGDLNVGTMKRKGNQERFLITDIDYDDSTFRWNSKDFSTGFNFTLQVSKSYIRFFHTKTTMGRIKANKNKVRFNKDKTKFGIPFSIVKDITIQLPIGKFEGYEEYLSEEEEGFLYEDYNKWGKLVGQYNVTPLRPGVKWVKTKGKDAKDDNDNTVCSPESCSIIH